MSSTKSLLKILNNYYLLDLEDKEFLLILICGDFMKEEDLESLKRFIRIIKRELEMIKIEYEIKKLYNRFNKKNVIN